MKTNITALPNGNYGKRIGDALYCSFGTCQEDAEFDVCWIYELVGGGLIAEADGILFPVEQTNWNGPYKFRLPVKRGRHSRSNNQAYNIAYYAKPIETDELPF